MTPAPIPAAGDSGLPLRTLLRQRLAGAVLVLVVVTVTTLGLSGVVLFGSLPRVVQADAMLEALQDGHAAMVDQETAVRGFLLTHDARFLEPYDQGTVELQRSNAALDEWADGGGSLDARIDEVHAAERRWVDEWATPLLAAPPTTTDAVATSATLLAGKQLFDAYRTAETAARAALEDDRDAAVRHERWALLTGAAVVLTVLVVALLFVRELDRRMSRQLVPPVEELRETLAALSAGDLQRRAQPTGPAEFRQIATAVNALGRALRERDDVVAAREGELVAARDEAERAGQAKTAFLATMSHEIRTPLNAVLGMTDLLLTTELTAEQRNHLEIIAGSGDHLLELLNDVLDFSRIEAGGLDLDCAPFELDELVYDVTQLLAPQAAAKGLDLMVDVPVDGPWQLLGDGPRLRQLVLNLVGNAVKFTEVGVVIVRVRGELVGDRVACRISVSDTGIGIPAAGLDRLFRSFSQVDASTTRIYGGTGLGLAISQRIARAMGGDISVDSEPGVGSTFAVEAELAVQPSISVRTTTDALAGRRLLVVDDSPTNLEILDQQLSRYGATCVLVGSGAAALAAVTTAAEPFDAAVLDLNMPEMPGDELATRLRDLPAAAALPLVLLSSSMSLHPDHREHFAARLHKPVRPDRLLRTVQSVLASGDAAAESRPAHAAAEGRDRLQVLVAEDNEVNAQLMQRYLDRLGHVCTVVPDGEEAVAAVLAGSFDIVLMDAQMPVLGGADATRAIRLMPIAQPRIVAVTASVLAGDRADFMSAGADDFMAKPVRLTTLAQTLERWSPTRAETPPDVVPAGTTDPAADDTAVLDEETVEELRDLGEEAVGQLYRQYLGSLADTVAAIQATAAGEAGDEDASVSRLAHRLKGGSAAMGALRLAAVCQRLEHAPAGADLRADLDDLVREQARVGGAVGELLAAAPVARA